MWHVETDYFALCVYIVMLIKIMRLKKDGRYDYRAFSFVLCLSIYTIILDIISSTAMNLCTSWWLYQTVMTLYCASMPLLAAAWVCYTYVLIGSGNSAKRITPMRRQITAVFATYIAYAALSFTNPRTGWFFGLTADIQYSRGPLFISVGVGAIMLYSVWGIIAVIKHRKRFAAKSDAVLMTFFFLVSATSIWVQLAHPGWLIIGACYAVVFIMCDMTIEEQQRKLLADTITAKNVSLSAAVAEATEANRAKTDFLSRMSHDIRTPLNAILNLTAMAKSETEDRERLQSDLEKISLSGEFLLGLINDILDMSRIESGKVRLEPDVYRFSEFIAYIDGIIAPLCAEKNIAFVWDKGTTDIDIYVDRTRFNQIFFNVLSNAVKYTEPGGRIDFIIDSKVSAEQLSVDFIVKDNGCGMKSEFIPKMFQPFERENATEAYTGTGLGLAITKNIIDMMGGTITADSRLGIGTTMCIHLDMAVATAEQIAEYSARRAKKAEAAGALCFGKRILVAEDHPLNREIIIRLLQKAGIETECAENGRLCVEAFERSEPYYFDAVLMDIRMPVMDGLEATRQIRALPRPDAQTVPIIAMTANAFADDKAASKAAGMNAHLSKPVVPETLYSTLAEYFDAAKARTKQIQGEL